MFETSRLLGAGVNAVQSPAVEVYQTMLWLPLHTHLGPVDFHCGSTRCISVLFRNQTRTV